MKNDPPISKEKLTELYYEHGSVHKVGIILNKNGDTIWRWLKHYEVAPKPKICKKCSVLLIEGNTYPSDWKHGNQMCKFCRQEECKNITPEKKSEYGFASRLKAKAETLDIYGNKCVCCGETNWQFLTIDHINNDGKKTKKRS